MTDNMAQYTVTSPDGDSYTVTAPDNATPEDLYEFVQTRIVAPTADAPTPAPVTSAAPEVAPVTATQPVTPSAPTAAETETEVRWGDDMDYTLGNPMRERAKAATAELNRLLADTTKTSDDIRAFTSSVEGQPYAFTNVEEVLAAREAGQDYTAAVTNDAMFDNILGPLDLQEDPNMGDFEAAHMRGQADNPLAVLIANTYKDWTDRDVGGVSKDDLRSRYPDMSEDEIEQMHEGLIGEVRRRRKQYLDYQLDQKDVGTGLRLLGDLTGGFSALDVVPLTRGGSYASRAAEAVIGNVAADAILQGTDMAYGAQDEFSPTQSLMAGAVGVATHGGLEATGALAKAATKRAAARFIPETRMGQEATGANIPDPIELPERGSIKKVAEDKKGQAEEYIASITEGWTNSPVIDVRTNFKGTKGLDKDSVAVYNADTGAVSVNMEAVIKRAKRRDQSVEDVLNAAIYHESLGHYGLAQQFGDTLESFLARVVDQGDPNIKRQINDWLEKNPKAYENEPNRDLLALEEILAETSEGGPLTRTIYDTVANMVKDFGRKMGIEVDFSEREIRSILSQAHKKVISGEGVGAQGSGYRTMYVGENSMTGSDPISRQTQFWFTGPDGKERFEIADNESALTPEFEQALIEGNPVSGPITDGFIHNRLFEEYPELKDITLRIHSPVLDFRKRVQGGFSPSSNTLTVTPYADDPRSVILHELQHAVQEIEGFARGGSSKTVLSAMPMRQLLNTADNYVKVLENKVETESIAVKALESAGTNPKMLEWRKAAQDRDLIWDDYKRTQESYGDDHPRTEEIRKQWSQLHRREFMALQEFVASYGVDPAQLQKADAREYFKQVGAIRKVWVTPKTTAEISEELNTFRQELRKSQARLVDLKTGIAKRNRSHIEDALSKDDDLTFEAYQALFGEVEARDVEYRRNLSDFDRLAVEPYESQGIPEDFYIYTFTDNEPNSNRYMRNETRPEDIEPLNIEDLSPEDLFESRNALDLLEEMTKDYEPTHLSMADLKAEAEMRGFTAADFLRTKPKNPGDIARRLMMYDIAVAKLDEKLTKLYSKLQSGDANQYTRAEYAKTLVRFQELAARTFDEQGEAARAVRAIQELNYTRRRVEGLKGALGNVNTSGLQEMLADPDTFFKFAKEIQDQLAHKKEALEQGKVSKIHGMAMDAISLPRAIMASSDFSAPFRQGLFLVGRPEFWKAFPSMFKYAMSEQTYKDLMKNITSHPNYDLMVKSNLQLSNQKSKLTQREEDFLSRWSDKIPIVKQSERAYAGFLNKLRADVFNNMLAALEARGSTIRTDEKALKDLGSFISNATGRGVITNQAINSATPLMTALFFSPRLILSRVQMMNPVYYTRMDPMVRMEAMKTLASSGALMMLVTSLLAYSGMDVQTDPRSSDFGKVKFGDTRYDIAGGAAQYMTLASRLYTNEYITPSGETKEYGSGQFERSRLDATQQFITNKASPITSYIVDWLRGKDAIGNDFDAVDSAGQRMVPLFIQDWYEMVDKYGGAEGTGRVAPSMFGFGVQDYKPWAIDPDRTLEAPEEFVRSGLPDGTYEVVGSATGELETLTVKDGHVTMSDNLQEVWAERLEGYRSMWMEQEINDPDWELKTDKEKEEIIDSVRSDAREAAREDMMEYFDL